MRSDIFPSNEPIVFVTYDQSIISSNDHIDMQWVNNSYQISRLKERQKGIIVLGSQTPISIQHGPDYISDEES